MFRYCLFLCSLFLLAFVPELAAAVSQQPAAASSQCVDCHSKVTRYLGSAKETQKERFEMSRAPFFNGPNLWNRSSSTCSLDLNLRLEQARFDMWFSVSLGLDCQGLIGASSPWRK